jgi:hypothetical protein
MKERKLLLLISLLAIFSLCSGNFFLKDFNETAGLVVRGFLSFAFLLLGRNKFFVSILVSWFRGDNQLF